MTTTRIDHTGHNHPKTTAARTACRKAMKAATPAVPMVTTLTVGNGKAIHFLDRVIGGTRCGKVNTASHMDSAPLTTVTCKACLAKYGQAHG